MDKIRTGSIKTTMTASFLIAIIGIAILSGFTIYAANQVQQKILVKKYVTVDSSDFQLDEDTGTYTFHADYLTRQPFSTTENIIYYGSYFAMIGLPSLYIVFGIGMTAAIYYKKKLRIPIAQLQNGVEKIQANDLDFHIEYHGADEMGQLCSSMEKMRQELRVNNKALWESLEQRKLLNASVAHDLRTPITVLKGYLDYLERNISQKKITEEILADTISSMQDALMRLEQYVECVRDVEKVECIELKSKPEKAASLLAEIEKNVCCLKQEKEIIIENQVTSAEICIDKSVFFRIFENLLQNALRFAEKRIVIEISEINTFLLLTVKDDGQGFSDIDLRKATTVFYSESKEHFGVGLSICKVLCEKHGGSLHITNNETKGACVIAKLKFL